MSNCETCPTSSECNTKEGCMIENNPLNHVKKIIGVMSGKGGVGKSTISVLLASELKRKGYKVGVLDADITGPSIPRLLQIKDKKAITNVLGIMPVIAESGIKVMSLNFLIDNEEDPVIWRGPIISGAVKQFWTDVVWGELDFLIIDMPPGTGDVALTAMQSIPINGIVMVSVPQDLVSMIVSKAVNMTRKMNVNIIGVIENMSYIICPDCKNKIRMYDNNNTEDFLNSMDLKLLGELPMTKEIIDISVNGLSGISEKMESELSSITDRILNSMDIK